MRGELGRTRRRRPAAQKIRRNPAGPGGEGAVQPCRYPRHAGGEAVCAAEAAEVRPEEVVFPGPAPAEGRERAGERDCPWASRPGQPLSLTLSQHALGEGTKRPWLLSPLPVD